MVPSGSPQEAESLLLSGSRAEAAPEAFAAAWAARPAERRPIVVYGRRCFENRYSRALGRSYKYSGQVAEGAPFDAIAAGHRDACEAALGGVAAARPTLRVAPSRATATARARRRDRRWRATRRRAAEQRRGCAG